MRTLNIHIRIIAASLLLIFSALLSFSGKAQNQKKPTAAQIIQRSIDSSGGKLLEALSTMEIISLLETPDNKNISFAVKKKNYDKCYVGVISDGFQNTTTTFNKGKASVIQNEIAQTIEDSSKLEELQLQCYFSVDLGYKRMGYKLERLQDDKFESYDCYVVQATSPLGRITSNYYSKSSGRLLMIIYPNQTKTMFMEYWMSEGISIPGVILIRDKTGNTSRSVLQKFFFNKKTDDAWFRLPANGNCIPPAIFKEGRFAYLHEYPGVVVERIKNRQVEIADKSTLKYDITWSSDSEYIMYGENKVDAKIKVRIISWEGNKYYCQYITGQNQGGTCAFEIIK